jgi:acid phosphatase type 7
MKLQEKPSIRPNGGRIPKLRRTSEHSLHPYHLGYLLGLAAIAVAVALASTSSPRPGLAAAGNLESESSAAVQAGATLVRGPYLQQVGADQAIVVWATRESGAARVEYRTGTGPLLLAAATSTFRASSATGIPNFYQHEATLNGLSSSTTYQYDLRVAGADPTPGVVDEFHTAPATGTGTIRLVAFGDSGLGSSAQGQIAARLDADTFDAALHTGDIAYSRGTYAEFDARFFPYYRNWLRRHAFWPSISNHDDMTGSATPLRQLFVLPRDGGSAAYPNNAERFYSADYGPVHLVALDTQAAFLSTARRQEQLAWLAADLQAAQHQPWRIAFFHRPPYSAGTEHGSDLAIRQAFGPLFEQYGVQIVVSGHEHSYERSVPWRESTNVSRQAVTYVVTGGAGAALHPVGMASFTAFSRSASHYVRMIFSPTDATLEAVGTNGAVFDRFALNLAQQQNDSDPPQVAIASPAAGAVLSGTETIEVSADDDSRVEKVDLWIDGQQRAIDLTEPYAFSLDTAAMANGSHTIEARAYDIDGRRMSTSRAVTVSNGGSGSDIVFYASEAPVRAGTWRIVSDTTAAGGRRLEQPDAGAATIEPPLASPVHYVDFTVNVAPDTNYRLWLRLKGAGNSGYNDSVWVQTSDTVDANDAPMIRIGTTSATRVNLQDCTGCSISGWGWQDNAFGAGALGPLLRFATGGAQTIRIQAREDGVSIDQVVLSPATYLNRAPGALRNDTRILPK